MLHALLRLGLTLKSCQIKAVVLLLRILQEDWFWDGDAYHWSFLTGKLRSAAQDSPHANELNFAGYTVPRKSGYFAGGLQQKMLAQVGGGAKVLRSYIFGVR